MPRIMRVTKGTAARRLGDVSAEKVFWCHDGRTFKNLRELRDGLEAMEDEAFHYHANELKADFAAWVCDVIGDDTLARNLAQSRNRLEAARRVADRLALYESKLT